MLGGSSKPEGNDVFLISMYCLWWSWALETLTLVENHGYGMSQTSLRYVITDHNNWSTITPSIAARRTHPCLSLPSTSVPSALFEPVPRKSAAKVLDMQLRLVRRICNHRASGCKQFPVRQWMCDLLSRERSHIPPWDKGKSSTQKYLVSGICFLSRKVTWPTL